MTTSLERLVSLAEDEAVDYEPTEAFENAVTRTSYQLSFHRSKSPRVFNDDGLNGEYIDNAYPGASRPQSPGDWSVGGSWSAYDKELSEADWIKNFFVMTIQEVVHEAMEWFQVDGRVLLDPHDHDGRHDVKANDIAGELAEKIWEVYSPDV